MKSSKRIKPSTLDSANLPYPPLAKDIICEVYRSMELLQADEQLLAFIGSWDETLSDEDVLVGLRFWIKLKKKELRRQRIAPTKSKSQGGQL